MKEKVIKTLAIMMLVFYAACIFIFKMGSVMCFLYFALLISAFFCERKAVLTMIFLAAALPIAEFIWVGIYSNWFDQTHFLSNLKTSSVFFDYGGFPGYVMWILVIPLAAHKLSHIWGKG